MFADHLYLATKFLTQGDEMISKQSIADLSKEREELIKRIAIIHFDDMTLDQLRKIATVLGVKTK